LTENREVPPDITPDEQLQQHIAGLERRLAELQSRLPAHSIPPAMLAELDELDSQLAEARRQQVKESTEAWQGVGRLRVGV
jgi:anti-sigma-K factor RskA